MSIAGSFLRLAAGLAILGATGTGAIILAKSRLGADSGAATITLRVYDYAHVHRAILLTAENEATRILAQTGVGARWVDCPTSHAEWNNYPNCQSAWQVNDFTLEFLPETMVGSFKNSQDWLGFTMDCAPGPSCAARVFYDRVRSLAGGATAAAPILLGRVLAHEIGHLLGISSHSRTGIMTAVWSDHEMSMEASHDLLFTRDQVRGMKNRLAERTQAGPAQARVVRLSRR